MDRKCQVSVEESTCQHDNSLIYGDMYFGSKLEFMLLSADCVGLCHCHKSTTVLYITIYCDINKFHFKINKSDMDCIFNFASHLFIIVYYHSYGVKQFMVFLLDC